MLSATDRITSPFAKDRSRQRAPTSPSGSKRFRAAGSSASWIAASIPAPRTSPTRGWPASSRTRAWK